MRDQSLPLDFHLVRDQELRYTSTDDLGYGQRFLGRTIYGSPTYTVVSGAADNQVQHLVVIEDREMKLDMNVRDTRILAFMCMFSTLWVYHYITSNEAVAMAQENQNRQEYYPVYGLVTDPEFLTFYRLDILQGTVWSRSPLRFSC